MLLKHVSHVFVHIELHTKRKGMRPYNGGVNQGEREVWRKRARGAREGTKCRSANASGGIKSKIECLPASVHAELRYTPVRLRCALIHRAIYRNCLIRPWMYVALVCWLFQEARIFVCFGHSKQSECIGDLSNTRKHAFSSDSLRFRL